jgi:hypothetical protein
MELFPDIDTAEKIAWGASGLLSFKQKAPLDRRL